MKNNLLGKQQDENRNIAYYHIVCDKHEYTTVTQTTTQNTGGGIRTVIKESSWMQCKKCGKIIGNEQRL